jgi:hypothetical protein
MMYSVYGGIKLMKRDNPYLNKRERVMDIVKTRKHPSGANQLLAMAKPWVVPIR